MYISAVWKWSLSQFRRLINMCWSVQNSQSSSNHVSFSLSLQCSNCSWSVYSWRFLNRNVIERRGEKVSVNVPSEKIFVFFFFCDEISLSTKFSIGKKLSRIVWMDTFIWILRRTGGAVAVYKSLFKALPSSKVSISTISWFLWLRSSQEQFSSIDASIDERKVFV